MLLGDRFVVLLPFALNQRCPCPVVSQAGFAGKGGVATHLLGKGSSQARLLPNTQVGRVATCNGQGGGGERKHTCFVARSGEVGGLDAARNGNVGGIIPASLRGLGVGAGRLW